jgi:uncharacterized protein YraI
MGILRKLRAGLLVISLLALVLGANGNALAQGIPDAVVATSVLTMRAGPARTAAVVTTLPRGTKLTLDGRDRNALWVHGTAETGAVGWVSKAYLSIRRTLAVFSLPELGADAAVAGGTGAANPPANTDNSAPPAPVVSGSIGGGFELGGQVQGLGGGTVAAMQQAGMKWVKQQVGAGDGSGYGMIDAAHANGFRILLSVVGAKDAVTNENYQNDYAAFVGNLAGHGADAIEVWNEMNIDREWPTGQIDPAVYVRLLAKAYNEIKSKNGNTMVITGAPAPTGAEGAFGTARVWNDDRYYAGLARAGAGRYADCIGVHYNEGIVGPNQTSGDPRDNYPTRYFSTMLNRAIGPFGGKKACFTELGYLTPEGYGQLPGGFAWAQGTSVSQQAAWLAQAAVRASNSGQVRLMIIFNVDFTFFGEDPQGGYAMIRPGGGCPACAALGQVAR